jgi:hypothetical protein
MANTEALAYIITNDFKLLLQDNETLFTIDTKYSLEESDFIQFIEITKTIIEITETFNAFAKLISNYSFFIPHNEIHDHNSFIINCQAIYKTIYRLFILVRRTFGTLNKNIPAKDFCIYQFRIHPFKPLRMQAKGQHNIFFQRYGTKRLTFSSHIDLCTNNILDVPRQEPKFSFNMNSKNRFESYDFLCSGSLLMI